VKKKFGGGRDKLDGEGACPDERGVERSSEHQGRSLACEGTHQNRKQKKKNQKEGGKASPLRHGGVVGRGGTWLVLGIQFLGGPRGKAMGGGGYV